ncbi:MAG: hypothetical protein NTZ74_10555 [Chloroflexi bacterium]|nr:hypothetical protein [Chloroflexota bacterium]
MLTWENAAPLKATVVYTDPSGASFTEAFNLTVPLTEPSFISTATATPSFVNKPQLVIVSNETDVDPLQPGSLFELDLNVKNLGYSDARGVTMILGGGVSSSTDSGTPQPGVSGSSADLANFAPLGGSNVIVIGEVKQGEAVSVKQNLVVNVTTQPGAHSFKISFVYMDQKGTKLIDDQMITLLVYSLPQMEITFYRDPGFFTVGVPTTLPIQVTNLGKKSNVLGNMKVNAKTAEILNNVSLVGALDPGGYYTLDSELTPMQEGSLDIEISINYTDDFNQPRFITQSITVEVQPAAVIEPGVNGENGGSLISDQTLPETFWSKALRFFKGLLGLDSGTTQTLPAGSEGIPSENPLPVIVPKG